MNMEIRDWFTFAGGVVGLLILTAGNFQPVEGGIIAGILSLVGYGIGTVVSNGSSQPEN